MCVTYKKFHRSILRATQKKISLKWVKLNPVNCSLVFCEYQFYTDMLRKKIVKYQYCWAELKTSTVCPF